MLARRFRRTGDIDGFHIAIKHSEQALATTPQDHPGRPTVFNNLVVEFFQKFQELGDLEDLQKAITHGDQARAATPQDHPRQASSCLHMGQCLELRSKILNCSEDINESLPLYQEACDCHTSPPRDRISASRRAASILFSTGQFHESSTLLERAVGLMPSVNLRLLNRDDQQHILSDLEGLSSSAASMALCAGREAYHSLQLLELGQGIIMGFTIDSRSEFSELEMDHPLELRQFNRLRAEIDSPIDGINGASFEPPDQAQNRVGSRHWDAVKQMDVILDRIRTFPGYCGFLLPPPPEDLMKLAEIGPLVVVNCTPYRSDAIIVTTSGITSLELRKLKYEETTRWMTQFGGFGAGGS
ncbi:unnamed protein product [Tuber aestivum]|uniref:CHAT domain-containing protein n=1 Tax=Tuber aestivum TaxID=59557 RepID=A0A292Q0I3_9PEZI|nr:unnamed protein product [Tuber aestivum]